MKKRNIYEKMLDNLFFTLNLAIIIMTVVRMFLDFNWFLILELVLCIYVFFLFAASGRAKEVCDEYHLSISSFFEKCYKKMNPEPIKPVKVEEPKINEAPKKRGKKSEKA